VLRLFDAAADPLTRFVEAASGRQHRARLQVHRDVVGIGLAQTLEHEKGIVDAIGRAVFEGERVPGEGIGLA